MKIKIISIFILSFFCVCAMNIQEQSDEDDGFKLKIKKFVFNIDNKDLNNFGYSVDEGGELTANSISIKDSLAYILDLFHRNLKVININTGTKSVIGLKEYAGKVFFPSECVLFNGYIYIVGLDGTILKLSEEGKILLKKKIDNFYGDKYILKVSANDFCLYMDGTTHQDKKTLGIIIEYYSIDKHNNINKGVYKNDSFNFKTYYNFRDSKGKNYSVGDSCEFKAMSRKIQLEECNLPSRIDFSNTHVVQLVRKEKQFELNVYNW